MIFFLFWGRNATYKKQILHGIPIFGCQDFRRFGHPGRQKSLKMLLDPMQYLDFDLDFGRYCRGLRSRKPLQKSRSQKSA